MWDTHSECLGRQLRDVSVCFIGAEGSIVTSSKFGKTVTLDQFIVNVRFVEKEHVRDISHRRSKFIFLLKLMISISIKYTLNRCCLATMTISC